MQPFLRQCLYEFLATILFLAGQTGAGAMADNLSQGNTAITLIGQSLGCSGSLFLLINIFSPLSFAHFNPLVSILFWEDLHFDTLKIIAYIVSQTAGSCVGVLFTNAMYAVPIFEYSTKRRDGFNLCISEVGATWVLLAAIYYWRNTDPKKIPTMIGILDFVGIWASSSTFFCNPAVTIARCITNTFIGIAPIDVGPFILSQVIALLVAIFMFRKPKPRNVKDSLLTSDPKESDELVEKV